MAYGPIVAAILQILLALLFGVLSVYAGLRVFARASKGTHELEELKKGNAAVGVLLAGSILAIAIIVHSLVGSVAGLLVPRPALHWLQSVVLALVVLLIGVLVGSLLVEGALWAFDHLSQGLDEGEELRRGNVAVALVMAGALVAVAFSVADSLGALAGQIHF
jgi:uncharacterized membrane protein YjfL (UPF0719 family)